jgi:hypothetical protein
MPHPIPLPVRQVIFQRAEQGQSASLIARSLGLVRVMLHRDYPAAPIPAERTLQRWFRRAGLIPAPSGRRTGPSSYHRAQQPLWI